MCFLDDCLVYTPNNWNLHLQQVSMVLERIRSANLSLKLTKCNFGFNEVPFLGHIVGKDGLKMDPKRVQKIKNIASPTNKTEVRSFLGLAGYYRAFIKNFSGIAGPLFRLTAKDVDETMFVWTEECQTSFSRYSQRQAIFLSNSSISKF